MAEVSVGPGSEWVAAISLVKGLAHLIRPDLDQAESCFVEAATSGTESQSLPALVMALGMRGLIAIDRHEWDLASDLASQALQIIDDHGLDGYHTSGFALVVAARAARRNNDIARAQNLLARASLVRPRMSAALPASSVYLLLENAKAYVELSDVAGARSLLREAEDIIIQRPDLGSLPEQVAQLKESLVGQGPGTVGLSTLTKAELRLLPLLATNLSFPEIGEELFISRHTVKTQAMSIYRKLGRSSRSDAVSAAYDIGLLRR
jgi:LuxR family maltose regulon positive regulatory protein